MTASPTPTDAGAGTPGEHHADPAYCSGADHSPDAGNFERALNLAARAMQRQFNAGGSEKDIEAAIWQHLGPAFEAKEREIEHWQTRATVFKRLMTDAQRDKADAEAKLAQAVEALEPFAKMAAAYDGLLEEEDVPVLAQNKLRITLNDLRRARSASARAIAAPGAATDSDYADECDSAGRITAALERRP